MNKVILLTFLIYVAFSCIYGYAKVNQIESSVGHITMAHTFCSTSCGGIRFFFFKGHQGGAKCIPPKGAKIKKKSWVHLRVVANFV